MIVTRTETSKLLLFADPVGSLNRVVSRCKLDLLLKRLPVSWKSNKTMIVRGSKVVL